MITFKLGDMVQIIKDSLGGCHDIGDIGTISEINHSNVRVHVLGKKNVGNWYEKSDLKLTPVAIDSIDSYYYL